MSTVTNKPMRHIGVVHPWKFKQNLPSGLRVVAFTRFRDVRTDRRTDKCNAICIRLWDCNAVAVPLFKTVIQYWSVPVEANDCKGNSVSVPVLAKSVQYVLQYQNQ
jgi:hypothetical protein